MTAINPTSYVTDLYKGGKKVGLSISKEGVRDMLAFHEAAHAVLAHQIGMRPYAVLLPHWVRSDGSPCLSGIVGTYVPYRNVPAIQLATMCAMGIEAEVLRHSHMGVPEIYASHIKEPEDDRSMAELALRQQRIKQFSWEDAREAAAKECRRNEKPIVRLGEYLVSNFRTSCGSAVRILPHYKGATDTSQVDAIHDPGKRSKITELYQSLDHTDLEISMDYVL